MNADARVRYLGLDWIDALTDAVAVDPTLADLATRHSIGVTQVVGDGPEGTVVYHLQLGEGAARFGAGPADPEQVRLDQEWSTAVAVATGELDAEEAFIRGLIRLTGDPTALEEALPVFAALDAVFGSVRERTDYR